MLRTSISSQRLKDMFFQVFFIPWRCFVMLKENLSFIGVCALVFAALLGLAYLFERTVCHDLQRRSRGLSPPVGNYTLPRRHLDSVV